MGRPHRLWFVRKRTQALDEGDEASTVTEVQYKWAGRKTVPSTPRVVAGQGKKGSPLLRPLTLGLGPGEGGCTGAMVV